MSVAYKQSMTINCTLITCPHQEKLQFYHVREKSGQNKGAEDGREGEDGLGRLPPHLDSVSSLLLFNTTHNP